MVTWYILGYLFAGAITLAINNVLNKEDKGQQPLEAAIVLTWPLFMAILIAIGISRLAELLFKKIGYWITKRVT